MNKAELIATVADKTNVSKKEAEDIVNATLEEIVAKLIAGEEVKLSGFGSFEKKARASRTGSNPATHERITIKASNTVSFKPSKSLKEKLN